MCTTWTLVGLFPIREPVCGVVVRCYSACVWSTGNAGLRCSRGHQIAQPQLLNLTPFPAFTQPIVRLDLDRMDDDDNRLFGITAQIAWTPKPSYQLTLRTPLYAIKN